MSASLRVTTAWAAFLAIAVAACAETSPLPSERPFTYLLKPHDQVGFKDSPHAFQITPDGSVNGGFGILQLAVGAPLKAVDQRTRTLHDGYLPLYAYEVHEGKVTYRLQVFAAAPDLDPRQNLLGYVRLSATNTTDGALPAQARLTWNRWRETPYVAALNCYPWYCESFHNAALWEASGTVTAASRTLVRSEHAIIRVDDDEATIRGGQDTATVDWSWSLPPGETRSGVIVMPLVPIWMGFPAQLGKLSAAAGWQDSFETIEAFWREELHRGMVIDVAEDKVSQTQKTSLAYMLMARDITADGQQVIHTVGENMYREFFSRDAAFFTRTYHMLNRPELARTTLEHFIIRDSDNRATGIKRLYPDDWGQSLWALGSYVRATSDTAFAEETLPAILNHVEAFEMAVNADPLGLWPAAGPYDNEGLTNGHYTGHSFWALLGLAEAERVARAADDPQSADRFAAIAAAYRQRFMANMDAVTEVTQGYIPPGLDDPLDGYDWANASGGVYPFGVLAPTDPRVSATLQALRPAKYREGLLFYGTNAWAIQQGRPKSLENLHAYLTHYVTQTLLARGEQRAVVEDFYAILAHSSSTHAGFEHSLRPWSETRDATWNRGPHGWWASRYIELLRNMLVREVDDTLHLGSALAPVWAQPGESVVVERAHTWFGVIDRLTFDFDDTGMSVTLEASWTTPPAHISIHAPFWTDRAGETWALKVADGVVTARCEWGWGETPDLSYQAAVDALEAGFASGAHPDMLF